MEKHEAELYIFGPDDQLITTITEETGLYAAPFKEGINQVSSFTFTVDATAEAAAHVVEENQVVFRDKEGDFRLFVIKEPTDRDGPDGPETEAVCEPWYMELKEHIVLDRRFVNQTADVALNAALEGTRATGRVIGEFGRATTNFYRLPAIDAIWEIPNVWGGELKDVVEFDGSRITARRMELHIRRGADRGKVFEIDHDIEEIERTVLSYPLTAMYGWGASLEIEDEQGEHTGGYTRYIDFADVEWSKAKGDPVDKPKGQKWVGDPVALQRYGRLYNGKRLHREGQYRNHDIEDPAELLEATWLHLQDVKEPEVSYRLSVGLLERLAGYEHEHVQLGDTAAAIDREFSREIVVQSRVISIEYDILDIEGTAIVEMGQFLSVHDQNLGREIDDLKAELDDTRAQANRPITNDRFLDIKPGTPSNVQAIGGIQVIQLYWSYDSNINIAHYEVYGSQVATFLPDSQHLLYRGRTSAFAHNVRTDEVWYYYVRAVNQRGTVGDFSPQVSASSQRVISDDILFGSVTAEHLAGNLDIADKLAQNTIDLINAGPMQEIAYTRDEIVATETRINKDLNARLGDVNSQITDLLSRADGVDGTLITVDSEIDRINGSLSSAVTELQNLNGVVSAHSTTLQQHAGLISAKAEASEVYTRVEVDTALGSKVDTTVYNTKMGQLDISINGISGRVASTETNINSLTGQMQTAKSDIAALDIQAESITQSVSSIRKDFDDRNIIPFDNRVGKVFERVAQSQNRAATVTGALIIRTPITSPFMSRVDLSGYNYTKGKADIDLSVSFYAYSTGILQHSFTSSGGFEIKRVRAAREDGKIILIIGDVDTVWSYPEILIEKAVIGYTDPPNSFRDGWGISFTTEIPSGWTNLTEIAGRDIQGAITSAEASIKTLAGEIKLRATKTTVDTLTGRMDTAEGRINILSDEIDLRVTKNGVIAGINISPEAIRIHGAKIHLTGQTLIDDAIIGTAALANLSVSRAKIQTGAVGTLQVEDGSITNAKIGNLAVDDAKIASLSATKLTAGTINSNVISIQGGSTADNTRIDGGRIRSEGRFEREFGAGQTAEYHAYTESWNGVYRSGLISKRANGITLTNITRWTALTDKGLTTQRAIHSGSSDYKGARFIDFFADETLTSDVFGQGMHIYSGQDMLVQSQYRTTIRSGTGWYTHMNGAGVQINADGPSLVLRKWSAFSSDTLTGGAYISLQAADGAQHGMLGIGTNDYNLQLMTRFGNLVRLRSNQETQVMNADGDSFRPLRASILYSQSSEVDLLFGRLYNSGGITYVQAHTDIYATGYKSTTLIPVRAAEFNIAGRGRIANESGTTYVQGNTEVRATRYNSGTLVPMVASSFNTSSLVSVKQDIEKWADDALEEIRRATLYAYRLKSEVADGIHHARYGFVIGNGSYVPLQILSRDGKGIDAYAHSSLNTKAIKQLDSKQRDLEGRVSTLELENQYLKQKIKALESA